MLLVQLGINNNRNIGNFAKLDSPWQIVQFWQNVQTSLPSHGYLYNSNKESIINN